LKWEVGMRKWEWERSRKGEKTEGGKVRSWEGESGKGSGNGKEVGMRKLEVKRKRKSEGGKDRGWEGEKDRGALRLRSTSFEERPGGLEKKGGRGKLLKGEVGIRKWEGGSGNLEGGSRKLEYFQFCKRALYK